MPSGDTLGRAIACFERTILSGNSKYDRKKLNKGGLSETDRDIQIRSLGLTAREQADLVAFLRALRGGP